MNGNTKIVITALVSVLLTFFGTFTGLWFTAVQGKESQYAQDRQFILDSIERLRTQDERFLGTVQALQSQQQNTNIQVAQGSIQYGEIIRRLDRIEATLSPLQP